MSERIEYPRLLREATLGLVRRLLLRAADEGLPGEHHFYLTFDTRSPGVELAPSLASRYPETMTVVLQHQWADLVVDDAAFAVTLRFGGVWERLRVPFSSLTSFLDPSVPFGLDFTQFAIAEAADAQAAESEAAESEAAVETMPPPGADDGGEAAEGEHRAEILPFRPR
ncbi:MAG: ClpXP protease specificity-enhancing factor SspB [Thermoanaerobaculia bacterium]|nr:ClpXP protease specificity-enhancing factor SspB [Thermoanaerobaculia bacterium]